MAFVNIVLRLVGIINPGVEIMSRYGISLELSPTTMIEKTVRR